MFKKMASVVILQVSQVDAILNKSSILKQNLIPLFNFDRDRTVVIVVFPTEPKPPVVT